MPVLDATDLAALAAAVWTYGSRQVDVLTINGDADVPVTLQYLLSGMRLEQAAAVGATSITLDPAASAVNDYYKGLTVILASGTGAGQARVITAYNGATKVATLARAWATNPVIGTWFVIVPLDLAGLTDVQTGMSALPSAAAIATAIISALTAAGALDTDTGVEGEQTVEMFLGEDHSIGVTLPDDMTGATFSFALSRTLADALAGTGTVAAVANADIAVAGQTVTVPADKIGSASLAQTTGESHLWYALRRTDAGNRRVVRWGPWVVVGA